MLTMARDGIYWRLRDTQTPWRDKAKLAQYAWGHDAVHMPNKHQVLLDWLTLALTGKKRVTAEEAEPLWNLFSNILSTHVCQANKTLSMKSVVGQVLIDELSVHRSGGRGRHCASTGTLLDCVDALLTSAALHPVFTAKHEMTVQLLAVIVELYHQSVTAGGNTSDEKAAALLRRLLVTMDGARWRRANYQLVVQAVCNSLLAPVAKLAETADRSDRVPLRNLSEALTAFTCSVLFNKDLFVHYQLYLGVKARSSHTDSALPKDVDHVIGTVQKLLTEKDSRSYMLRFLPDLYKGFLSAYWCGENPVGLDLLRILVRMIILDLEEQADGEGHVEVSEEGLTTLSLLLEVVVEQEVYNPAVMEPSQRESQLAWLKVLGQRLITATNRPCVWYDCLRHLLSVDHTSLEPCLSQLLSAAWVDSQDLSEEQQDSQGRFLSELVTLYGRLRRFPAMIGRWLAAFKVRSVSGPLPWSTQLDDSLNRAISGLPANTVVSLWSTILEDFKEHYNTNPGSANGLHGWCYLLALLLLHARLADHTVPAPVAAQVTALLETTQTDILNVLLPTAKAEPAALLTPALQVAWAHGELRLLLSCFTSYTLGGVSSAASSPYWDLSLVQPSLKGKGWALVFKKAEKQQDKAAQYLTVLLVIQKLRALLSLEPSTAQTDENIRREGIKNIVDYLLNLFPGANVELDVTHTWNHAVGRLSTKSHQVAVFELLCEHITLLVPFCSTEQLLPLAELLLRVQSGTAGQSPARSEGHASMTTVACKLLTGAICGELVSLQTALTTVLLQRLTQILKQPLSVEQDAESAVTQILRLFSKSKKSYSPSNQEKDEVLQLMKVYDMLPVEHFQLQNKTWCLLALLAVIRTNQLELVRTGLKQLPIILEGPDVSALLETVDLTKILSWILRTADSETLSLREDVIFSVIKTATKDINKAKGLRGYVNECSSVLTSAISGSSLQCSQVVLVGKTFSSLRSVIERARQEAALREVCGTYFQQLGDRMLQLFAALREQWRQNPDVAVSGLLWETVLRSYRHLVAYVCRRKRHHQAKQRTKKMDEARKKEEEREDEEEPMDTSAEPTHESASSSEDSSSSGDESPREDDPARGQDRVDDMDEPLIAGTCSHLTDACSICLCILKKGLDSTASTSCLPLVVTICTNSSLLERHLPEDFLSTSLTSLLAALHRDDVLPLTSPVGVSLRSSKDNQCLTDVMTVLNVKHMQTDVMNDITGSPSRERARDLAHSLAAILSTLTSEQLSRYLEELVKSLNTGCLQAQPGRVVVAMETIKELLSARLDELNYQVLGYVSRNMLPPLQDLLRLCSLWPEGTTTRSVITAALDTQTKMLTHGEALLTPRLVTVTLHSCQYVPLEGVANLEAFSAYHQGTYELLNALLVHHQGAVLAAIPAYISATKRLMTSVILQADQSRRPLAEVHVDLLVTCALRVYRLFSLITLHKVDFGKVAAYIVADYIDCLQKVTMLPAVKKSLVGGVHKILSLCDVHAVSMLRTALPASGKEVFRALHLEYTKYHRYTGRV